jgi:arylsulfatase B
MRSVKYRLDWAWCALSLVLLTKRGVLCAAKPHIVHIVADDLGYNDLGALNGNKTLTPALNSLIQEEGVLLTNYYTFRVCAPSRAASMTGRYPWSLGFYDMSNDGMHCVHPSFKMLPELLRTAGYRTHATGKWDVGYVEEHCTPTFRGFETFLGYYTACTSDYW